MGRRVKHHELPRGSTRPRPARHDGPELESGPAVTHPGRAHDILAKLIVQSATKSLSLPAALCAACVADLPMTGAAIVLQSIAGLDRVVAATEGIATVVEE